MKRKTSRTREDKPQQKPRGNSRKVKRWDCKWSQSFEFGDVCEEKRGSSEKKSHAEKKYFREKKI